MINRITIVLSTQEQKTEFSRFLKRHYFDGQLVKDVMKTCDCFILKRDNTPKI